MTEREIQAILTLLSDDDKEVVRAVRKKLADMSRETVVGIHAAAGSHVRAQQEITQLLVRMNDPPLDKQFEDLSLSPEIDLEVGTFLIAKFGYPEVQSDPYVDLLDEMAADLSPHVSKNDHPIHTIRELNAYLFDEKGFKGGAVRNPENSFINRVLDRRVGIPITLSAVYLFLSRRLGLPISGVGMPGHFSVKYSGADLEIFVDPFNRGEVITRKECQEIVTRFGNTFDNSCLEPTPNRHILVRMMNNLMLGYLSKGEGGKVNKLKNYVKIMDHRP